MITATVATGATVAPAATATARTMTMTMVATVATATVEEAAADHRAARQLVTHHL